MAPEQLTLRPVPANQLEELEEGLVVRFGDAWSSEEDEAIRGTWPDLVDRFRRWKERGGRDGALIVRLKRRLFVAMALGRTARAVTDIQTFAAGRRLPLLEVVLPEEPAEEYEDISTDEARPPSRLLAGDRTGLPEVFVEPLPPAPHPGLIAVEGEVFSKGPEGLSRLADAGWEPVSTPARGASFGKWGGGLFGWSGDRVWLFDEGCWDLLHLPEEGELFGTKDALVLLGERCWRWVEGEWEELDKPDGSGRLWPVEGGALWSGSDGMVWWFHRVYRSSWWKAGKVEGAVSSPCAIEGGWCSARYLQCGGPPVVLDGPGEGVVLPAHRCGAVLLHRRIYRLLAVGAMWVEIGPLGGRITAAVVARNGSIVARNEHGQTLRISLRVRAVPVERMLGDPEERLRTWWTMLLDAGAVEGSFERWDDTDRPRAGEAVQWLVGRGIRVHDPAYVERIAAVLLYRWGSDKT